VGGAVAAYREGLRHLPNNPDLLNDLAWVRAAGPDGVRDGKEAVELATRACELSRWMTPDFIDTLAAAYAEAGDFARAVEYQKKALTFPSFEKAGGAEARWRIEQYTQKKPFRDPALARREVAPPPRPVPPRP
jgi:hypothetical protein